jgi:hypothetical protein
LSFHNLNFKIGLNKKALPFFRKAFHLKRKQRK